MSSPTREMSRYFTEKHNPPFNRSAQRRGRLGTRRAARVGAQLTAALGNKREHLLEQILKREHSTHL
jgi:hypothetical protein